MKLGIIVGTTREGRVTHKISRWVEKEANKYDEIEAKLIDLKDYPMPFFDESISPQYNPERKPIASVKKFLDELDKYDAYVVVTPEYNRSFSGVLKNALDFTDFQFNRKAVQIVSHGSTGGAQAVSQLRVVIPGVGGITLPKAVMINSSIVADINDAGDMNPEISDNPYGPSGALKMALDDLVWYVGALSKAK